MASNFTATDAAGYELTMGRWSRLLAKSFLSFAPVERGAQVLDLGCGTGSLTRALLEEVGDAGAVVGVDVAEPYIAHARATIEDRRARFEVADASSLTYADSSFDAVRSILVLNFIPEYRTARPRCCGSPAGRDRRGGSVGHRRRRVDDASVLGCRRRARREAASFRDRTTAGPLTGAGELRQVFVDAGAADVEERDVLIRMEFASFEDYWTPLLSGQGTLGSYTISLDDRGPRAAARGLRDAYLSGRPDGPRASPRRPGGEGPQGLKPRLDAPRDRRWLCGAVPLARGRHGHAGAERDWDGHTAGGDVGPSAR
jgi:SAM-dependent methyltransferase